MQVTGPMCKVEVQTASGQSGLAAVAVGFKLPWSVSLVPP